MANMMLLAIIFLGAVVRFWGIDFCLLLGKQEWVFLPMCRVDEELTWAVALRFFSGDLNPHFFNYPTLLPYTVAVLDAIYLTGKFLFWADGSLDLVKQTIAMNPSDLILLSRGLVALLGTLTIFLVHRIAQKLYGQIEALFSAFFLAFAYLHVRDSHFATTDVPMAFMVCLSFLFIIRVYQRGKRKDYLWAGFISGLATSTKWPAFLLILPILAAHFLRKKESVPLGFGRPALALSSMLFAVLLGTPFVLLSPQEFWEDIQRLQLIQSQPDWRGINLGIGWIYHFKFTLWYGLGWPLFLASLLGVGVDFKRHWKETLLLLSFVLPYYVFMGNQHLVFMRYMVPLIPFLCIFAGVFVSSFSQKVSDTVSDTATRPQAGRGLAVTGLMGIFISLLIIFPSLCRIYWLDRMLSKPDSRIVAGDWINQNIPKDKKIILLSLIMGDPAINIPRSTIKDPYWARRLEWPPKFLGLKQDAQPYSYFRIDPAAYEQAKEVLNRRDFDYLIVDASPLPMRSVGPDILQDLKARYDLVKVFRGVGNNPKMISDQQDGFYLPIAGAQYAEHSGPDICILKRNGIK